jgi:hypothetical protein
MPSLLFREETITIVAKTSSFAEWGDGVVTAWWRPDPKIAGELRLPVRAEGYGIWRIPTTESQKEKRATPGGATGLIRN